MSSDAVHLLRPHGPLKDSSAAEPASAGGVAPRAAPGAGQTAARLVEAARSSGVDRLVRLAARLLSAPSAQVSLLTSVQTVAGGWGLSPGAVGRQGPLQDSLCTVTAALGGALVVADTREDDRVSRLPPVVAGEVGSYLGVPLRALDGQVVGALCVFGPEPRTWEATDAALLEELAAAVMAELELAALSQDYEDSRLRWEAALDAAGIGSFDWDLTTDRVDWDERLQGMFGYGSGEYVPHMAAAFSRIHPDDRPAVDHAIEGALASGGHYHTEFRVRLPDGSEPWIAARGQAICDRAGVPVRLIGTCHDVTEVRTARDQAALLLESMATGFASIDADWTLTYLNAAGAKVVGYTAAELVGRNLWEAFPGLAESEFGEHYRRAMQTRETVEVAAFYDHLQGWFEVRVVPTTTGLSIYFMDITARYTAQQRASREHERAQAAVARLAMLAQVSAELAASSLQTAQAVQRLAELVVPLLGDWAVVTLGDGAAGEVGSWHVEDELRSVVAAYAALRLDVTEPGSPVARARRTAAPVVLDRAAAERTAQQLASPAAQAAWQRLAPRSGVVLPLAARGHVGGTLTVCRGAGRPELSAEEMSLAQEVADRAGLALDNARLYAEQRGLAEALQLSLLTEPPQPDHGQIVVRYASAAQAASVGGDWFDSFIQADGATTVVIGDVVGHDTQAAAAMGQVRGLLRGIAWDSGATPASVLTRLDAALEGLQVRTTASAIVGRLQQTADERVRGVTRWCWSNAGHPPPVVLGADGSVTLLAGPVPDLLLGIDPSSSREESEVVLEPGATVLLYTDGLVERRREDLDIGLARLRDTLQALGALDLSLDALCDELLTRLSPSAEDDVALLAVRLHRQDGPRSDAPPGPVTPGSAVRPPASA